MTWIVCQIGAREHFAIPRALHQQGKLSCLITDCWVPPRSLTGRLARGGRMADRWHDDLRTAQVWAPNGRLFALEIENRIRQRRGWEVNLDRNRSFQKLACNYLLRRQSESGVESLFSYSYAARDLFRWAKKFGLRTVLGQIDPGPEEERIVAGERLRYPDLPSAWEPAPSHYWDNWREEVDLADTVIVNSQWSRQCLLKEGVADGKIEVIPLVYGNTPSTAQRRGDDVAQRSEDAITNRIFKVLFLGQINLRKGAARLIDAMRILRNESIELTLVGPSEFDPVMWSDLPNVRWLGCVARRDVGRHYTDADLFVLPTLSDGFALTQLEALAHGVPVLASKHCGDVVQTGINGRILDDLEPSTIADAILCASKTSGGCKVASVPHFSLVDLGNRLLATGVS